MALAGRSAPYCFRQGTGVPKSVHPLRLIQIMGMSNPSRDEQIYTQSLDGTNPIAFFTVT